MNFKLKKSMVLSVVTAFMLSTISGINAVATSDTVDSLYQNKKDVISDNTQSNLNVLDILQQKRDIIKEARDTYLSTKPSNALYKGIDVSAWQSNIDWLKVKEQGVEFAILRAGYVSSANEVMYTDTYFETNYQQCKKYNIPVGCYWFTRATTIPQAKKEAEYFLKIIQGKQFEYPVCFDIESSVMDSLTSRQRTDITIAFCDVLEDAGYYTSIYTNVYWIENKLYSDDLILYDKWLAHWTSTPKYGNEYGGLWQYGTDYCYGIQGEVDSNYSYRDYTSIIKKSGLNGFTTTEPIVTEPTVTTTTEEPTITTTSIPDTTTVEPTQSTTTVETSKSNIVLGTTTEPTITTPEPVVTTTPEDTTSSEEDTYPPYWRY